jgi:serine/threonine protein phosphatase PrpC
MEALTNESHRDLLLAMTPGRMFRTGASENACIFTQQGRKGCNQDAMLVWEKFGSMEDTVFCGVFDGHGPFGHLVAKRVRDSLPSKLVALWFDKWEASREEATAGGDSIGDISRRTEYGSNVSTSYESAVSDPEDLVLKEPPGLFWPWKESHLMAFKEMDHELRTHPAIDTFCSGSTAVTVIKQGRHLIVGNVGDSRAIMGTQDENGSWRAVQLTVDLKPNLPREAERIKECQGRIFSLQDEPEVMRVWLPFDNSPGLAMARAFGDSCLKDYGVIAVPDVSYRQVTDRDKFIVLASDGIWDVLSNEEAVEIIATAPSRETAARFLVESAVRMWRLKYPTSKADDCAVVCLYLDVADPDPLSVSELLDYEKMLTSPSSIPETRRKEDVQENGKTDAKSPVEMPEVNEQEARLHRTLGDLLHTDETEEYHALEGVTRVNSLLNLPRKPVAPAPRPELP